MTPRHWRAVLVCALLFLYGHAVAQPAAPSGLTATTAAQINLSWTDNSSDESGFAIYLATDPNGTWYHWTTVGPNSTSYTVSGLTAGTLYYFRLHTYNGSGNSGWSNNASATTPTAPTAPSGLSASVVNEKQVNLSWTDNSNNETAFAVYLRINGSGPFVHWSTASANATSIAVSWLDPGTYYDFRILAYNAGGSSSWSNDTSASTPAVPMAPTALSATAASGTQINLAWTDNSVVETAYAIYIKSDIYAPYSHWTTVGANSTSYSVTGLTPGTYYNFSIHAYNASGNSGWSNEAGATTPQVPPAAPSALSVGDLTGGQVRLTWTDNSWNEASFQLERKTGVGGTYALITSPAANSTLYDDSGLTVGSTYYYRIRAANVAGYSAYSNEVVITGSPATQTSGTVTYTYDPFGNLVQTNAGGVTTTIAYDLRGRKTSMADPDMGTWTYTYNALGELIKQKDAKNQEAVMAYDALGRMSSRVEADLESTWTYDSCTKGVGKLCSVSADNGYARTVSYDSVGRVSSIATTIDSSQTISYSYDSSSRLDVTTYPTGFAVQNVYNAQGYLLKVQRTNDTDTTVYWQATSQNAAGQVTGETLGNGLATTRTYDTLFRLTAIQAANGGGSVHSHSYTYDAIGNLTQRTDNVQSVTERFTYDSLNRLISASGGALMTRSFDYDAIGNVTYKSDVGSYTYGTKPHAVTSVANGTAANSVSATYTYDANGSLTGASGTIYPASGSVSFSRTLTYTSYNHPATISQTQGSDSYSYTYTYGADHERVKLVTVRPDDTLTSVYLHPAGKGALLYEKETRTSDSRVEHKHYVNGGAGLVGVFVTKSAYGTGDGPQMRYYHLDHLGSVARITNPSASALETLAYEAFGERRQPSGTPQDRASPIVGVSTDRGFTAHEHLDELNLVHMNGRIYDPALGRFMTSDPFISGATDLQSYNRYSYVNNNPLGYTDPSGYIKIKDVAKIGIAVGIAYMTGYYNFGTLLAPSIGAFGATATGLAGGAAAFGNAVAAGAAFGGIMTGTVEGAARGGATAGLFWGAGSLGEAMNWAVGGPKMIGLHAAAGCASSAASGGDCTSGAMSAGFAQAALPHLPGEIGSPENFVSYAVIGGTASVLGGGKFANGAMTASFSYIFNDWAHQEGMAKAAQAGWKPDVGLPGTSTADAAVDYWVQRDNAFMGTLAAAWTPDNAPSTALALGSGVAGMFRPYWQYYPEGATNYASNWLVRGWNPPYALGNEAVTKLALPPYNNALALRQVHVPIQQFVRGPRGVTSNYGQPGGGLEWKRGWKF